MITDNMSPFNGNFYDSNGNVRNIDGGSGNNMNMSPFNGNFYDSNGDVRNIDELGGTGGGLAGAPGKNGWSPISIPVNDGDRIVRQLVDWIGGTGTKPDIYIGYYESTDGFVNDITKAIDYRGKSGNNAAFNVNVVSQKFRNALTSLKLGLTTASPKVAIIGDSISEGRNLVDPDVQRFGYVLAKSINDTMGKETGGGFVQWDDVYKYGSGVWAQTPFSLGVGFGGRTRQTTTIGAYAIFEVVCKKITVLISRQAGGGTAQIATEQGTTVLYSINTEGANGVIEYTYEFPTQAAQRFRITMSTAGNLGIIGFVAYAENEGVHIDTFAVAGSATGDWITQYSLPTLATPALRNADLVVCFLGGNDIIGKVPIPDYKERLMTLIATLVAQGNKVLMWTGGVMTPDNEETVKLYLDAAREVADMAAVFGVGFLDYHDVLSLAMTSDNTHPNIVGHYEYAKAFFMSEAFRVI